MMDLVRFIKEMDGRVEGKIKKEKGKKKLTLKGKRSLLDCFEI
jgi:hypothetical protein